MPMGTVAYGGKGFKGRAAVSDEGPTGAASCRQQHNQVSGQTLTQDSSHKHKNRTPTEKNSPSNRQSKN